MVTLYVFILIVGAVGGGAYLALFFSLVPGAKDERLGKLEELPAEIGKWVPAAERTEEGLIQETRYLSAEPSGSDPVKIIIQVRYRDPGTSDIVRVDPEKTYRRRRRRLA